MMRKLSPDELSDLARKLVAGEITKEAYLDAVLGDAETDFEPLPAEPSDRSFADQRAARAAPLAAGQTVLPPRRRLTDAEIDALARRAKALL